MEHILSGLLPYGDFANDLHVPSLDDGSTDEVALRQPFPFFGQKQKVVYVSVIMKIIDNHDSGYLGMAVLLYVQAHLGHYHILT